MGSDADEFSNGLSTVCTKGKRRRHWFSGLRGPMNPRNLEKCASYAIIFLPTRIQVSQSQSSTGWLSAPMPF